MTEAFLYRNPAEPLSDFMGGGFAVYNQEHTKFTQGELVELQAQSLSRFSGKLDLILPPPDYIRGQTTAIATLLVPTLGGRDFDVLPVGYGSIVTNKGPSQLVGTNIDHEITELYVIPETSDGLKLERKGIASAILHKLIADLDPDEKVIVRNIPDFGLIQTNQLISNMMKLKLMKKRTQVQKYDGATQFTVANSGQHAVIVRSMLEIYKPWMNDRERLSEAVEKLQESFINTELPDNVVDLTDFKRKKQVA